MTSTLPAQSLLIGLCGISSGISEREIYPADSFLDVLIGIRVQVLDEGTLTAWKAIWEPVRE